MESPLRSHGEDKASQFPVKVALSVVFAAVVSSPIRSPLVAQSPAAPAARPALAAVRLPGPEPRIDGVLDEPVWSMAAVADDFTQFRPRPGAAPSQRTEARVLYGGDALFVAIRAWDSAPDSIVALLARRDEDGRSDRVGVLIDSYLDRRTAWQFTVNPRGVKRDARRYDDVEEDDRWDPVWDVATRIDAGGWSAEFRIPYSQLRFGGADVQTWGIQFHRDIARLDELSLWAPTRPEDEALVSRFGELRDLRGLRRPARLEIMPYAMSSVREGTTPGDPAARGYSTAAGADIKYGITSNLTLDVTVNPDFGQVEADPAIVNLSAFETFYPERRPFFQEAANLFDFQISLGDGDDDFETLFYSRRVGRQPQGLTSGDTRFASPSARTTILGAAKLSGRTAGGWSIGLMNATTAEESARVLDPDAKRDEVTVEPRANYTVARVVRDFRGGRSAIGAIATAVLRDAEVAADLRLPRTALAGGLDLRHRFAGDRYELSGWLMGSSVRGTNDAIARVQTSAVHYFQRPDADHVRYDPSREGLSGAAGQLRLHKVSGGPWRGGVGVHFRSPGFEVGDAGFQRSSDLRIGYAELGYERTQPIGPFRSLEAYTTHWGVYSGAGERLERGGNVRSEFVLKNLWGGWFGIEYNLEGLSPALLRGGPAFRREPELMGWGGVFSDARHALGGRLEGFWSVRPESGSRLWELSPSVTWRPTPVITLRGGPFYARQTEDRQWLGRGEGADPAYLFGRLHRQTLGATLRADVAFSPALTLQLYAQPFISAGEYEDFRRIADPHARTYRGRFTDIAYERLADGRLRVDLDADGIHELHDNPDFNFRRLRTNVVLRWEYRPGSTLYLVWSQGRDDVVADGSFAPGRDLRGLFGARSEDALMLKLSYWWSL